MKILVTYLSKGCSSDWSRLSKSQNFKPVSTTIDIWIFKDLLIKIRSMKGLLFLMKQVSEWTRFVKLEG